MLQSQCEFERRRSKATVQGKWPGAARSGRVPSLTDTPYGWHCTYCTCVRADQRESQAPVHGMARPAACCRVQGPPVLGLAIALAPAEAGTATKRPCASRCGCVSCRRGPGGARRGPCIALHRTALARVRMHGWVWCGSRVSRRAGMGIRVRACMDPAEITRRPGPHGRGPRQAVATWSTTQARCVACAACLAVVRVAGHRLLLIRACNCAYDAKQSMLSSFSLCRPPSLTFVLEIQCVRASEN